MHRNTFAQIDLSAIRHNFEVANRLAPNSRNIAVVKADAYGHGGVQVALELQKVAPALAVAFLDEAMELRDAGVRRPILILEGVDGSGALRCAIDNNFWVMVHNTEHVELIAGSSITPNVWVKVDTGMHRLGFALDAAEGVVRRLQASGVGPENLVLCTHLATADDNASGLAERQVSRFRGAVRAFHYPLSIANSAGIVSWPSSHAEWNRPGYMLYGNSPMKCSTAIDLELIPAMRLVSSVIAIRELTLNNTVGYGARWSAGRESRIGTVAIGYADGYPRHAPNGTKTLVNGRVAPLVGTVSMDMISVDLTDHPNAKVGDPVILWGPELPVDQIANAAGTIGYQLLTSVSRRVPRIYSGLD